MKIVIIGGLVLVIIGGIAYILSQPSVSEGGGGSVFMALSCESDQTLRTNDIVVTDSERAFGDPVTARSEFVAGLRDRAESEALELVDDALGALPCPEECPTATAQGTPAPASSGRITRQDQGFVWTYLEAEATASASVTFQCLPEA